MTRPGCARSCSRSSLRPSLSSSSTRFGSPALVSRLEGFLPGRVEWVDKDEDEDKDDVPHDEDEQPADKDNAPHDEDKQPVELEIVDNEVVGLEMVAERAKFSFRLLAFCDPFRATTIKSDNGRSMSASWP